MSPAGRPGCPAAAESRWRKGFAPLRASTRPDQRCPAPRVAFGRQPCIVWPPCRHLEVSRIKIRTGIGRARCRRTASRSRRRSGCVADDRPRPRACCSYRGSSGVGVFSRTANSYGPARRTGTLRSRSCQCTHARRDRRVGPHRLIVAGHAERVHIVEAMPAISRRSTFRLHEPARSKPPAVPTEIQPKYNRNTTETQP